METDLNEATPAQVDTYRLRMEVVSAALSYAASDVYLSSVAIGPAASDDAEMELKTAMLDRAVAAYGGALGSVEPGFVGTPKLTIRLAPKEMTGE